MIEDTVMAKTAKGRDEIKTRAYHLDNQLRRILLLVDDKSSIRRLKEKTPVYRDLMNDTLELLVEGGYVVPVDGAQAVSRLAAETNQEELTEIKEAVYALLRQILGDNEAVQLRTKIGDDPQSMYELRTCFDACVRMVRLTIDEDKAAQLEKLARPLLK
jgi:hypothetical protein